MSLETLNNPALIAISGAAAAAGGPVLASAVLHTAPMTVRTLAAAAYSLNLYATQQPGRIDGMQGISTPNTSVRIDKDLLKNIAAYDSRRGTSLLAPKGYAFGIWAPIFLGELIFCASSFFVSPLQPLAAVIQQVSSGFIMSQVFQVLWTASFRPKHLKGKQIYISSAMLSGIAYSLNQAHQVFTSVHRRDVYSLGEYLVFFLPLSLHFGWTTAAALVNINGNVAGLHGDNPQLVAAVGHTSAIGATALGVFITVTRQAPVYGGVIAWALAACAAGMHDRLQTSGTIVDSNRAGIYGARVQKYLCGIGAAVSAGVALFTAVNGNKAK